VAYTIDVAKSARQQIQFSDNYTIPRLQTYFTHSRRNVTIIQTVEGQPLAFPLSWQYISQVATAVCIPSKIVIRQASACLKFIQLTGGEFAFALRKSCTFRTRWTSMSINTLGFSFSFLTSSEHILTDLVSPTTCIAYEPIITLAPF
jgi:hypothetical protein